ncbi:hypothetical protein RN001_010735 [Aquatica leii]|uniref:Peptidase S1 domain-containing protein n=1 Tax=Aquatica leii TaxID=1421715 RepID=A0AAN7P6Y1_9COLE|nr:hypothetical protein RN001_010735 [Aquatica leii]
MYRLVPVFFLVTACCYGYGRNLVGKIVGGEETTIEKYPYQLSLLKGDAHFCGAILIKNNVVLTAGHCVDNANVSDYKTRAGSSHRTHGGTILKVKKACVHPMYMSVSNDYDVAVLLLEKPYQLSTSISTIPLQSRGVEVATGLMGTATGWGSLVFDGPLADVLQMVNVPKIDPTTCKNFYPEENVTARMACYGYKKGEKDVCHGDSGGPVAVNGRVAGIASWGYGCAFPDRPNVYTKISDREIHDFVSKFLKNTRNFVNC